MSLATHRKSSTVLESALDVCLIVVSECLMEFAEDTGVGPRLQETPLMPGVVTRTVSGVSVPRQHSQKLLFHIVVGTRFRYPEFAAPELLRGPHCMVEEIAAQREKLIGSGNTSARRFRRVTTHRVRRRSSPAIRPRRRGTGSEMVKAFFAMPGASPGSKHST